MERTLEYLLLQVWGGLCYFLNKLLFSKTERATDARQAEVAALGLDCLSRWRGQEAGQSHIWLEHPSKVKVVAGLGLSLYDFDGITRLTQ